MLFLERFWNEEFFYLVLMSLLLLMLGPYPNGMLGRGLLSQTENHGDEPVFGDGYERSRGRDALNKTRTDSRH